MVVISDTSCLVALAHIGELNLLNKTFNEIHIPVAVHKELLLLKEYEIDVSVFSASWIKIHQASNLPLVDQLKEILDTGEAEAIALSLEMEADLLIIDEKKGREVAKSFSLNFTGIGGVLIRSKIKGLIPSVKDYLIRIRDESGFYLSDKAIKVILEAAGETL